MHVICCASCSWTDCISSCRKIVNLHCMQEPQHSEQPHEVKGNKGRPRSRNRKAATADTNELPALSAPAIPSTMSANRRARNPAESIPEATVNRPGTGLQDGALNQKHCQRLQGGDMQTAPPSDLQPARQKQDGKMKARSRQNNFEELEKTDQLKFPLLQPEQASSSNLVPQLDSRAPASPEEQSHSKNGRQRRKPRSASGQPGSSQNDQGPDSRKRELVQPVQEAGGHTFTPLLAPPGMGKGPLQEANGLGKLPSSALQEDGSARVPQHAMAKRPKSRVENTRNEDVPGILGLVFLSRARMRNYLTCNYKNTLNQKDLPCKTD